MKKFSASLFAAVMMAAGLVAFSGSANAADPYPGSIDTTCVAQALNNPRVGHAAKVSFRANTDGNGGASGNVTFSYERQKAGVIVAEFTRQYNGPGDSEYAFRGVPRGRYFVRVFFNSRPADSVYKNCRTSFSQKVRPRR